VVQDDAEIARAVEVMRWASREVCGGFELGIDVERLARGAHYQDKRPMAKKMWSTITLTLQDIGAAPRRASSA
jgi:hypothetical protein